MNIGILTWHKSLNHGAILQAYATQNFLKANGVDSKILDYNRKVKDYRGFFEINIPRLKKIFNGTILERKKVSDMDKEKRQIFDTFIKEHLICGGRVEEEDLDILIIGSDMVFNLLQGYNNYMFGVGTKARKIISYAASAGGSNVELAKKIGVKEAITEALNKFSAIGYRDIETKKFVEELNVNNLLVENIDPVLLYGFDREKNDWNENDWNKHEKYLLIYAYHGFMNDKTEVEQIKRYARENNLKLVSCGYYHSWCDENINASPKEFLEMVYNADCIVTDTFHGTIFSIICEKKFVSIIRDNAFKLKYLLREAFLELRIAKNSQEIYELLKIDVDYVKCNDWLKIQRRKSAKYLLGNTKVGE